MNRDKLIIRKVSNTPYKRLAHKFTPWVLLSRRRLPMVGYIGWYDLELDMYVYPFRTQRLAILAGCQALTRLEG